MASFPERPGATASRHADQPPPIRRAAPGGSSRTRATARQSAVDGNAPGHPSESVLPRRGRAERGPGRPGSPYSSADVPAIRPVQPYAAMPVSASRAESSARRRPGTHPTAPSRNRPNWMICIPGYIAAGDVKPRLFGRESVGNASGPASPILTGYGRRVGSLGPGLTSDSADAVRAVLRDDLSAGPQVFTAPAGDAGLICPAWTRGRGSQVRRASGCVPPLNLRKGWL
jgi:hypothetical protein